MSVTPKTCSTVSKTIWKTKRGSDRSDGGDNVAVKIARAVFRYIEHELFHYDQTLRELMDMQTQLSYIDLTPAYREAAASIAGGHVGDQTSRQAIRRITTSAAVATMARSITAIDRALAQLSEDHRAVFELRYQKEWPWEIVSREMHISERTYQRLRRKLVLVVGCELGLINPMEI